MEVSQCMMCVDCGYSSDECCVEQEDDRHEYLVDAQSAASPKNDVCPACHLHIPVDNSYFRQAFFLLLPFLLRVR